MLLRVEGRRKRTLGAYFFCFFNLYFSCENTVFFPNVELFAIKASTISSPVAPSLFIASMSSLDKFWAVLLSTRDLLSLVSSCTWPSAPSCMLSSRDGASAAAQGTSPSAPTLKREPKGRPASGCSEQVLFPIFTVAAGVRRKKARRSPSLMSRRTLQPSHASRGIAGGGGGSIGVAGS
jgi:hypothetical protein